MFRKRKQLSKSIVAKATSYLSAVANTQYSSQLQTHSKLSRSVNTQNSWINHYRKQVPIASTERTWKHLALETAANNMRRIKLSTLERKVPTLSTGHSCQTFSTRWKQSKSNAGNRLDLARGAACLNEGWRRSRVYMLRHSTLMLKVNSAIINQCCFLYSVVDLHPQLVSITLSRSGFVINRLAGFGLAARVRIRHLL